MSEETIHLHAIRQMTLAHLQSNTSCRATVPVVWVVPAELYVGPAGPLLQPGLGYFQWALFVSEGLLQRLYQHLRLEDLLQSLGEETRWTQNEMTEKQFIAKSW